MDRKTTPINITTGGKEYHPKASELIAKTFTTDPVLRFMLSSLDETTRLNYLPKYIYTILKAASLNDATFAEANDWSCVAVWMPPGKRVDNPLTIFQAGLLGVLWEGGFMAVKRAIWDYATQTDAAKKIGLRDSNGQAIKTYDYLFFIATDFAARGQGIATKVVSQQQEKCTQDGRPIWLEATTEHSRDIYLRLGFKIVQEMVLGKGTHAPSGALEKGGQGVRVWGMIWWPSGKESGEGAPS